MSVKRCRIVRNCWRCMWITLIVIIRRTRNITLMNREIVNRFSG